MELLITPAIGVVIGLVLGLTGAGGSVFAVPLLIILLQLPMQQASGIALAAVAASALYGSLRNWGNRRILWVPALVLGTGGASRAVVCVLEDVGITYRYVSRQSSSEAISYKALRQEHSLADFPLIINTTPLGMSPQVDTTPDLAYAQLTPEHFCYDLVYNPEETLFMKRSREQGAQTKNGLEMLHLQAEKSWEIWNA